jgi:hypothetical protein
LLCEPQKAISLINTTLPFKLSSLSALPCPALPRDMKSR